MTIPYLIDAASLEDGPALCFLYPPGPARGEAEERRPVQWRGRDLLITPDEQLVLLARGDAFLWVEPVHAGCDFSSSPDRGSFTVRVDPDDVKAWLRAMEF